jgi:hypothetical protein
VFAYDRADEMLCNHPSVTFPGSVCRRMHLHAPQPCALLPETSSLHLLPSRLMVDFAVLEDFARENVGCI